MMTKIIIPMNTNAKRNRYEQIDIDFLKVEALKGKYVYHYHDKSKKRHFVFCAELQQNMDVRGNVIYHRCEYNLEADKFDYKHKFNFTILMPPNFQIPPYFEPEKTRYNKKICDLVAEFTIKTNISLKTASDDAMKDFITDESKNKSLSISKGYPYSKIFI